MKRYLTFSLLITLLTLVLVPFNSARAQEQALPTNWADQIKWRSIGPANMSGRITSIAVYEKDPCIWWAATASGGLLKTTNNGVNFEHQFDSESTVSIGDVQVSQSDPNIVWVGTGEANPRNSVSWGDGVYKSTDGGKTWKNMGLKKTFQVGRIAIHPENPDIVYVGALGRLWGESEERGLFKTTDGGKNWKKIHYINDMTGVIDVQMHPKDPETLLIATYERKRDGFDGNDPVKKYGDGSAIYKTTDGGKTFVKLTNGLPTCKLGRIGIDYYRKNPKYVYAIVESEKIASQPENAGYAGLSAEDAEVGARITAVTKDAPAAKAGMKENDVILQINGKLIHTYAELLEEIRRHKAGDVLDIVGSRDKETIEIELELAKRPQRNGRTRRGRNPFTGTLGGQAANLQGQQGGKDEHQFGGVYMSKNGGESWERINTLNPRPMYYSQLRVDPSDRKHLYVLGTSLYRSKDGGETFTGDGGRGIHPDNHAMWIDPNDGRHMILGNDGGIYITHDRMDNWDHHNHVAIGQFYHVGIDHRDNYNVYGGLQDNGSWGGPSRSRSGGILNTDWFRVGGGDGFICLVDPEDPNQLYVESQNGAMQRLNLKTGATGFIRPRAQRGVRYRFNWKTPFVLSPHNSKVHYSAGNYVFRSLKKGDGTVAISPEITNTDRGAGSAISESPVQQGVIYVGTTDGAVWMTKDGGANWTPLYLKRAEPKSEEEDKAEEKKEESKKDDSKKEPAEGNAQSSESSKTEKAEEPKEQSSDDQPETPAESDNSISGKWNVQLISDRIPRGGSDNTFDLNVDDEGKISGVYASRRGEQEITDGKYDKETGKVEIVMESRRGETKFAGELKDGKIVGEIDFAGRFKIQFEATRDDDQNLHNVSLIVGSQQEEDDDVTALSGHWAGTLKSEQLPAEMLEFELILTFKKDGTVEGIADTAQGQAELAEGSYNAERKTFSGYLQNDAFGAEITAKMASKKKLEGTISVNDGQLEVEFEAVFDRPFKQKEEGSSGAENSDTKKTQTKEKPQEEAKPDTAKTESSPSDRPRKNDPVAGNWEGEFVSNFFQGDQSKFTLRFKTDGKGKITGGSIESERLNGDVTAGEYDLGKNTIGFFVETTRNEIEFSGSLKDGKVEGTADVGGGRFEFEFKMNRSADQSEPKKDEADTTVAKSQLKSDDGDGSLASLVPGPRWVSSIEASRFKGGRVYLTLDGHRSNDDEPYVFASENYGKTWTSIRANLPTSAGCTRVIREDAKNENVLYLGCEFSAWVSIDRGKSWTKFGGGLPTVAIHEFAVHPTAGEIVAATHGRSLWIADVRLLQQLKPNAKSEDAFLYEPNRVVKTRRSQQRGAAGTRQFRGSNPYSGARIFYSLGDRANAVKLTVSDIKGDVIRELDTNTEQGLHVVEWDLRRTPRQGTGNRRFGGFGQVPSGTYLLTLTVDGKEFKQTLEIEDDPHHPVNAAAEELQELEKFWNELLGDDD